MNWKKLYKTIVFPPLWVIIISTLLAVAGMILVIANGFANHPLFYCIYAESFYALCVLSIYTTLNFSKILKKIKGRVYNNKYSNRYITDIDFKMHITLYLSLIMSIGNIVLNVVYGFMYNTNWFFLLAFYYAILTVLRLLLKNFAKRNALGKNMYGEWRRARLCAAILTLINLSLSGVVLMMMYQNRGFIYAGMLIYVMAAYSFYHITVAIVELVRYRKYNSPIMNAVKMVKFAAALVSMLSLETAMLTAFGAEMDIFEKRIMIASTGAGICVLVTGFSSYMIIKSTKELNKIKENNNV